MYSSLREAACAANRALAAHRLVTLSFGNASAADHRLGVFAIKPSGLECSALEPTDCVIVDFEGRIVEGPLRPSSDTPTHRRLYQAWPHVGGIAHTHSPFATAFAQAGRPLPALGTTHADHFDGPVPVTRALTEAEIDGAYEWATGTVIVQSLGERDPLSCPAALVRGHGAFTWGHDATAAALHAAAVEFCAQLAVLTGQIHAAAEPLPAPLRRRHFRRKHGSDATYGQRAGPGRT